MKAIALFLLCTTLSFSATVTYEWRTLSPQKNGRSLIEFLKQLSTLEKWQIDMMKPIQLWGYGSFTILYVYPIRAITNK
jgi:hypothetical protein